MAPDEQQPLMKAPDDGLIQLGALLRKRRIELGYTHRPAFTRERLPLTRRGNPNTRLVADIEKAYRRDFPDYRLEELARAYRVTIESVVAVAYLRAAVLIPTSFDTIRAVPDVPAEPPRWTAPTDDEARAAANRSWFDQIQGRLDLLRARGVAEPSGRQLFPDAPDDAKAWDGIGPRMEIDDRVWIIADLRRRAHDRGGTSGNSAAGA